MKDNLWALKLFVLIYLFDYPIAVEVEKQDISPQLERFELQTDPLIQQKRLVHIVAETLFIKKYPISLNVSLASCRLVFPFMIYRQGRP